MNEAAKNVVTVSIPRTPLRIDMSVRPNSYLRIICYIVLASITVLLAWLADLLLWQYVFIVIVSAAVVSYLALSRPTLLHLSQPPLERLIDQGWQLYMRTGRGDELWQARLCGISHHQWLVMIKFTTTEPFKRALTMTIYRDQVSPHDWRQLNILANIMSGSLTKAYKP